MTDPPPELPGGVGERGALGSYWKSLQADRAWVKRRVETGFLVDTSHVDLRVSLDLNIHVLRDRLEEHGLDFHGWAPIPLVEIIKGPQLDLDVRAASGVPCSVLASESVAHVDHCYLIAQILDQGIPEEVLTPLFLEQTYDILLENQGLDLFEEITQALNQKEKGDASAFHGLGMSLADEEVWNAVLDNDLLFELIGDLAVGCFLITFVRLDNDGSIVKYRRIAEAEVQRRAGLMALGLKPLGMSVNISGVGSALREHTRVVAPEGTRLVGGALVNFDGSPGPEQAVRVDGSRIVFYTRRAKAAGYLLRVEFVPRV